MRSEKAGIPFRRTRALHRYSWRARGGNCALASIIAIGLAAACLGNDASPQEDPAQAIDRELTRRAAAGQMSGAVLVARGGEVLYQIGFGLADRERGIPISVETPFNICSMGKMFTAAAVMLLVEEGRVDVSEPIGTYLPGFPEGPGQGITVHHLLSHTSGLGNYMARRDWQSRSDSYTTIDSVYELVKEERPEFSPGDRFRYSNSGYMTLGKIIENVSGMSYFDFVESRIFAPLGMEDSEFHLVSDRPEGVAIGYTTSDAGRFLREPGGVPNPGADGGVHSTVGDLLKFDSALHGGTLVSERSRDLMFTPNLNGYGYGLSIKPPDEHASGRTSIGHTGGLQDRTTLLRHFVEDDTVIIVLTNLPEVAFDVARAIEAIVYGVEQR